MTTNDNNVHRPDGNGYVLNDTLSDRQCADYGRSIICPFMRHVVPEPETTATELMTPVMVSVTLVLLDENVYDVS